MDVGDYYYDSVVLTLIYCSVDSPEKLGGN